MNSSYFFSKSDTTIFIASDHAGFVHKQKIIEYLIEKKLLYEDVGTHSTESCDYPDIVEKFAKAMKNNEKNLGILICGSANGVAMAANKFSYLRAAICWDEEIASLARKHNNANVICLPSRFINVSICLKFISIFLCTEFEGGRHQKRVEKLGQLH